MAFWPIKMLIEARPRPDILVKGVLDVAMTSADVRPVTRG